MYFILFIILAICYFQDGLSRLRVFLISETKLQRADQAKKSDQSNRVNNQ